MDAPGPQKPGVLLFLLYRNQGQLSAMRRSVRGLSWYSPPSRAEQERRICLAAGCDGICLSRSLCGHQLFLKVKVNALNKLRENVGAAWWLNDVATGARIQG